ncbi:MAG: NAD(P)H-dependent oxidoreductase [Schleiferiaceae bacterium]
MKKIVAIGGSNSSTSINKQLAVYTAKRAASTSETPAEVHVIDLNDYDLPIYGIDLEKLNGIPQAAKDMWSHIETADGIVISLAEHNGSYSAAFKSAFDWMSRHQKDVWANKPMILMGTSPGGRGAIGVIEAAAQKFPRMGAQIVAQYSLPSFSQNFTGEAIADADKESELQAAIEALISAM